MEDSKIPVIAVVGPTASGKTAFAISLASKLNGEIVSADSMQIYKGMQIATAKPTKEEMALIPHHLIDFLDPGVAFSAADYVKLAHEKIHDIYSRNKQPIIVGGTGLYVDSLLQNISFAENAFDISVRTELYRLHEEKGLDFLLDKLAAFDPESASRLAGGKNPKRIIRAIEIYQVTGITMTEHNNRSKTKDSIYGVLKIGLSYRNRQWLYDGINNRVDKMMDSGLLEEAKAIFSKLGDTAVQAIGYKELIPFFKKEKTLDECIEMLKMQTRRYAKRQITWFKKDPDIHWIYMDDYKEVENCV